MARRVKSLQNNKVGISKRHRDHQPVKSRQKHNRPGRKFWRRLYKTKIEKLKINELEHEDY